MNQYEFSPLGTFNDLYVEYRGYKIDKQFFELERKLLDEKIDRLEENRPRA